MGLADRVLAECDALVTAIEADPLSTNPPCRPAGHQPEPLLVRADRALRDAGSSTTLRCRCPVGLAT